MMFSSVFFSAIRLLVRGRYLYFALATLLFMVAATFMAAAFSGRQPVTVGLDVGISVLRFCLPVFSAVIVQGLVANEFDRRYFLATMTYPHSRIIWLMGRFAAVTVVVLIALLVHALVLRTTAEVIGQGYDQATSVVLGQPYWLVIGFMFIDFVVITSVAMLIAVAASSPGFVVFGTLGFLLIARSFSSIFALLDGSTGLVKNEATYREGLGFLYFLFPDLGALDIRAVALYGKYEFLPPIWPQQLTSAFFYMLVMTSLAIWAIQRKRFD
jgi:Cu-processing system permease protein